MVEENGASLLFSHLVQQHTKFCGYWRYIRLSAFIVQAQKFYLYLGSTLSGHLSSFVVKCARWSDGRGLYYLFACIFSYLYLFFIYLFFSLKKEGSRKGSRRGSKKGSKRGVQKGGSTFCLHPEITQDQGAEEYNRLQSVSKVGEQN